MDIQKIFNYIGTNALEDVLSIVYGIHKQSIDDNKLNETFQVELVFTSGYIAHGYLVGFDKEKHLLTLANFENSGQNIAVQYIDSQGIKSVGIENFEKNIEKFCMNRIPEGLGEPPTILGLKREAQAVQESLHDVFKSSLTINVDWEGLDKESQRELWAVEGILKQIAHLKKLVENDTDFIDAFNESIGQITISNGQPGNMDIHDGIFTLSFDFSAGFINVTKAEAMVDFLSKNL